MLCSAYEMSDPTLAQWRRGASCRGCCERSCWRARSHRTETTFPFATSVARRPQRGADPHLGDAVGIAARGQSLYAILRFYQVAERCLGPTFNSQFPF